MGGQRWEVVGGGDRGGIVVRAGRHLSSAELPARLEKFSLVEEVARFGERVKYKLIRGNGPEEGWVSARLKDKVLLEPRDEEVSSIEGRLEALREEFPGCANLVIPKEAADWSDSDLRNFFESGGFIKPKILNKEKLEKDIPAAAEGAFEGPQFAVPEALQLQDKLLTAFKSQEFQEKLKRLQAQYPQRKQKGHRDGPVYFQAFEVLVMAVFCSVFPAHGLRGDWDGVRDMFAMMASALTHLKVKRQHEEINILLGLPRDARLIAPSKKEDLLVYCPGGNGNPPFDSHLIQDEDGDVAHEFLVENEATGELCAALVSRPASDKM